MGVGVGVGGAFSCTHTWQKQGLVKITFEHIAIVRQTNPVRLPSSHSRARTHTHTLSLTHTHIGGTRERDGAARTEEEGEREEDLNSGGVPIFYVALEIRLRFEDLVTV